jgi:hypothetical protein
MDNQAAFCDFLQYGIGLGQVRQRNAVITYGFNTCRGMMDTSNDGISNLFDTISKENRNLVAADVVNI